MKKLFILVCKCNKIISLHKKLNSLYTNKYSYMSNSILNKHNAQDFQQRENVNIDSFNHSNIISVYEFCKSGKMMHCLYWASAGIRSTCCRVRQWSVTVFRALLWGVIGNQKKTVSL
jgi:hypothetical protein